MWLYLPIASGDEFDAYHALQAEHSLELQMPFIMHTMRQANMPQPECLQDPAVWHMQLSAYSLSAAPSQQLNAPVLQGAAFQAGAHHGWCDQLQQACFVALCSTISRL